MGGVRGFGGVRLSAAAGGVDRRRFGYRGPVLHDRAHPVRMAERRALGQNLGARRRPQCPETEGNPDHLGPGRGGRSGMAGLAARTRDLGRNGGLAFGVVFQIARPADFVKRRPPGHQFESGGQAGFRPRHHRTGFVGGVKSARHSGGGRRRPQGRLRRPPRQAGHQGGGA